MLTRARAESALSRTRGLAAPGPRYLWARCRPPSANAVGGRAPLRWPLSRSVIDSVGRRAPSSRGSPNRRGEALCRLRERQRAE